MANIHSYNKDDEKESVNIIDLRRDNNSSEFNKYVNFSN